ncbi:nucleotidyltransferase domain-containing protein [Kineothrix sp. MB12-C1]|uniref:nucleotidyltransferase domain-containing protein n=1 Tax=Kineothrix sp. MB12-C1 TaxID=3070215 RepID=UPI0027D1EF80|nr:nucleotidyltransferase domain-containing protein [Kineothrix sp. MB12-C1]WMC91417.1 nucleotidyltransferase domain-containing protein [Kineothrix sp. MB12-C1]
MVDNIIQLVTEKLSSLSYIEGIVLGGSRARGTHTEDSDIDIGIYYDSEAFDLNVLNLLAAELDDDHRSNLVVPPGAWGAWINGGGWLVIDGYHVDLILRDMKRVEQIMKDTEQGIVTANYQTGHPHGYISVMYRGELAISKVLYNKNNGFNELKKRAEIYPAALQKGLTEFFMFETSFSLMFAKSNMGRDDTYYVCGHCFRSISSLNQVLFAVNKEYCINEKKAVKMIGSFKIKPIDYKEKVDKVISLISSDIDCTKEGIEILQGLVDEVEHLKGGIFNERTR